MFGSLYNKKCNLKEISPLSLAFIGDCVFDLFVREKLLREVNRPVGDLHNLSSKIVCCQAQSKSFEKIKDSLTDKELSIYRRGRNAHVTNIPKNATNFEYHSATGLESLFGYLYLEENIDRIKELFSIIFEKEG